ncbi:MAG: AraC family transcriptional regulator [Burkholderiaceae bacterium]
MEYPVVQLNFRDGSSRCRVLHEDAVLSSSPFGWGALYFEHRSGQALETVEHVMDEHYLMVKLNPFSRAWRVLDGVARREVQQRGSTAYIPGGCSHRVQYEGYLGRLHLMTLGPALVEQVAQELGIGRIEIPPHHADARNDFILNAAELVYSELQQGNPHGSMFAEVFARALAVHLLTGFSRSAPAEPRKPSISRTRIRHLDEYIRANMASQISLAELAAQAGLSEYHFCRVFKNTTQLSPYQYLLRRRVQHACSHLEKDRLSVQEIAFACGFGDPVQFSRQFKKLMGVTPTAYRMSSRTPERRS